MARKAGRKPPRFTSKAISEFLDAIEDSSIHLVGWTLVPPNQMNTSGEAGKGRQAFLPVDALDCAGFKGRGQGHFFLSRTFCVSRTLLVTHVYILPDELCHPPSTYLYLHLPTSPTNPLTHSPTTQPLRTFTYLFLPLPTSTYLYLPPTAHLLTRSPAHRPPTHPLTRSPAHPLTFSPTLYLPLPASPYARTPAHLLGLTSTHFFSNNLFGETVEAC